MSAIRGERSLDEALAKSGIGLSARASAPEFAFTPSGGTCEVLMTQDYNPSTRGFHGATPVPIYLKESDVAEFLDMPSAIGALREAFAARARGEAVIVPRTRWEFGDRRLNVMGGGMRSPNRYALKSYGSSAYHVLL